jgi:DNA ligase (NAD+)
LNFFDNEENKIIIARLKNYGIQFEIVENINPNATDKLVGKICCLVLNSFPDELKKVIEDNGGKIGSSISAKTNYVVEQICIN